MLETEVESRLTPDGKVWKTPSSSFQEERIPGWRIQLFNIHTPYKVSSVSGERLGKKDGKIARLFIRLQSLISIIRNSQKDLTIFILTEGSRLSGHLSHICSETLEIFGINSK